MTGDAVENILAYALAIFMGNQARLVSTASKKLVEIARRRKWFDKIDEKDILFSIRESSARLRASYRERKEGDTSYLHNVLIAYAKQLTLAEYYDIIGVEFTVTSCDLQDKIERFFNHKTSPQLPVCKAVQMTGSFPVAFRSLKWKK